MTQQHQIIAIVKSRKQRWKDLLTSTYQLFQKPDLFNGFIRSYKPTREDESPLPQERKTPQASVAGSLKGLKSSMVAAFDTVRTQDEANRLAKATVTVRLPDGDSLVLKDVPATHLLFLEKQAVDMMTAAQAIPVLDSADKWTTDTASSLWRAEPHQTVRTRKVPKVIVKYEATDKHPAQTEMIAEDIPVGTFDSVKFSGAVQQDSKNAIVERVTAFAEAVKQAREMANTQEITDFKEGAEIFDFIFGE